MEEIVLTLENEGGQWELQVYFLDLESFNLLACHGDPVWAKWASLHRNPRKRLRTWDEDQPAARVEASWDPEAQVEGAAEWLRNGPEPTPEAELAGFYFEPPQVTAAKAKAEAREGRE